MTTQSKQKKNVRLHLTFHAATSRGHLSRSSYTRGHPYRTSYTRGHFSWRSPPRFLYPCSSLPVFLYSWPFLPVFLYSWPFLPVFKALILHNQKRIESSSTCTCTLHTFLTRRMSVPSGNGQGARSGRQIMSE